MDEENKTNATIKAYLSRGRQLWQRAARESGTDLDKLEPTVYLAWLEKLLPTLKPASRRQYIAGAKEFLGDLLESNKTCQGGRDNLLVAIRRIQSIQSSDYSSETKTTPYRGQTSSQKMKRCNPAMVAMLYRETKGMRGKWIKPAILWMTANILVGLRPSEWRHAYLDVAGDKTILKVVNGKNTHGRSHGEMRHLELITVESGVLNLIQMQINAASQYAKEDASWNTYYSGVRRAIHQITRKCLPYQRKYPTLYSTRHQFAADAKSTGLSKAEIAALMGHAVDTTAECHYGKKKHGSGGCRVRPKSEEVARVRVRSVTKPAKRPKLNYHLLK